MEVCLQSKPVFALQLIPSVMIRRPCAARVEKSKDRLDRGHTRRMILRGAEQVEPQIPQGRPLVHIQANVTMQNMVLLHAPATLHLRDVLEYAPNRCLAFHAAPAIVLLHQDPVVIARHMRRPNRRLRCAPRFTVATGRRGVWSQHGPDGIEFSTLF